MEGNIKIEIGDFLGFCDLNGVEALESSQVEQLERIIATCNEYTNKGEQLVVDAIYDRLMEILRKVAPESELCKYIWEDSNEELDKDDESDKLFLANPMYSIRTCKSYTCDELADFIKKLPDNKEFEAHLSIKENGHGIRVVYKNGELYKARSRARSSAGRDLTRQAKVFLSNDGVLNIPDLEDLDYCEIRGEMVLPFSNLDTAKSYNSDIKSAFSAVASMSRDSASDEEISLLHFVAYSIYADGLEFSTKEDEYSFLEDLGFETPMSWVIGGLTKETLLDELPSIISDCEEAVKPDSNGLNGYDYYSDGVVFEVNDRDLFKEMGSDGTKYKYGNVALKVDYWKQDFYTGVVQTILWTKGKSKLSPVAIVAEDSDMIRFTDYGDHAYVTSLDEIENAKDLGVLTAGGNKVTRVPLYEPNNMLLLKAYKGEVINFRYGGESGVIPCFPDGTPLVDGKLNQMFNNIEDDAEFGANYN